MSKKYMEEKLTIQEPTTKECARCGRSLELGLTVYNNGDDNFPEIKKGQGMHLECYIKHCIDKYINQLTIKT